MHACTSAGAGNITEKLIGWDHRLHCGVFVEPLCDGTEYMYHLPSVSGK